MSRLPEASFPTVPTAARSSGSAAPPAASVGIGKVLSWIGVCVLAVVGWAASTSVQMAHAGNVHWSIGVNLPGVVPDTYHQRPPVVVYQEPVPTYRPPVVLHSPPGYVVVPPPPVGWVQYPRAGQPAYPRHPNYYHHYYGPYGPGHHSHHRRDRRYDERRYSGPHQRGDW